LLFLFAFWVDEECDMRYETSQTADGTIVLQLPDTQDNIIMMRWCPVLSRCVYF